MRRKKEMEISNIQKALYDFENDLDIIDYKFNTTKILIWPFVRFQLFNHVLTKKLNLTSIVVTHNLESVFRIADRVAMIYQGSVLEIDTPENIKNSTNPIVQQFIKGEIEGPIALS